MPNVQRTPGKSVDAVVSAGVTELVPRCLGVPLVSSELIRK